MKKQSLCKKYKLNIYIFGVDWLNKKGLTKTMELSKKN